MTPIQAYPGELVFEGSLCIDHIVKTEGPSAWLLSFWVPFDMGRKAHHHIMGLLLTSQARTLLSLRALLNATTSSAALWWRQFVNGRDKQTPFGGF